MLLPAWGSRQVFGCCCGAGCPGGSLWVSVGDLSSFCCSLGFHAGTDRTLSGFLEGLWLWFHLLPNLSQKIHSCLSPSLHTHRDGSQDGVAHPPPLPHGMRHSVIGLGCMWGCVSGTHLCPGDVTKGVTTAQYLGSFTPRGSGAPDEVQQCHITPARSTLFSRVTGQGCLCLRQWTG